MHFILFVLGLSSSILASTININQTSADALLRQQKQQIKSKKIFSQKKSSIKIPKFKSNLFKKHKHINFILKKVNIRASKELSKIEIESIFNPFYGKKISLSKLQGLVEKATNKILEKGFILSHAYLPEQTIDNGIVTVNIVQGFINKYQIVGKINENNKTLIDQYISPIIKSKIFNNKTLERALLSINLLPGVTAKSVISPNKKTPDAAMLTLFVTQKELTISAKIDNFANKLQGREQILIGLNSYKYLNGEISAWIGHSLESNNSRNFSMIYKTFLKDDSGTLLFSFHISDSIPNYAAIGMPTLNDQGLAKELSLKYSYPTILTRDLSNRISFKFNVHNSDMENLDTNNLTFSDKIRSISLIDSVKFNDITQGKNKIMLSLTQGINIFDANNERPSRIDGTLNFTKLNLLFNRTQPLFYGINWNLLTMGQYSFNPLLVSEEFNLGGHGYDFGEIAGDKGYSVYNEFYYNLKPNVFNLQLYGFHYVGTVFNINDISQLKRESLASAGIGTRVLFNENVNANLYIGKPLTRAVSLEGNNKLRLFFSLNFNMSS